MICAECGTKFTKICKCPNCGCTKCVEDLDRLKKGLGFPSESKANKRALKLFSDHEFQNALKEEIDQVIPMPLSFESVEKGQKLEDMRITLKPPYRLSGTKLNLNSPSDTTSIPLH